VQFWNILLLLLLLLLYLLYGNILSRLLADNLASGKIAFHFNDFQEGLTAKVVHDFKLLPWHKWHLCSTAMLHNIHC